MNDRQAAVVPKIIVIVGPTGAGKTGLAINLARQLDAEIVGADSMQIYRHMDIGTAKPTAEQRMLVPHHLIDIIDPTQHFSLSAARPRQSHNPVALEFQLQPAPLPPDILAHFICPDHILPLIPRLIG